MYFCVSLRYSNVNVKQSQFNKKISKQHYSLNHCVYTIHAPNATVCFNSLPTFQRNKTHLNKIAYKKIISLFLCAEPTNVFVNREICYSLPFVREQLLLLLFWSMRNKYINYYQPYYDNRVIN